MLKLVVLSCMLAVAAASLLAPLAPLGYSASLGYSAPLGYSASLGYSSPLLTSYGHNYRGPLSLARGQPANIIAADGRPFDTVDVNLDRSAHYTAKALEGGAVHLLRKRSAPLVAPLGRVALSSPLVHSPLAYTAPVYGARLAVSPVSYAAAPIAHYY